MYTLTPEGREYAPQSELLEALLERPKDAVELVSELEWPIETVREHLRHYIQNGLIQRVKGEPQRGSESARVSLLGLDPEMERKIAEML